MLPATARRQTRFPRPATTQVPPIWRELPTEQQRYVAHILATLVRRMGEMPSTKEWRHDERA